MHINMNMYTDIFIATDVYQQGTKEETKERKSGNRKEKGKERRPSQRNVVKFFFDPCTSDNS